VPTPLFHYIVDVLACSVEKGFLDPFQPLSLDGTRIARQGGKPLAHCLAHADHGEAQFR
jgi:hypothetical protein